MIFVTSASGHLVTLEDFSPGCVVCDASAPVNVSTHGMQRPDVFTTMEVLHSCRSRSIRVSILGWLHQERFTDAKSRGFSSQVTRRFRILGVEVTSLATTLRHTVTQSLKSAVYMSPILR